MNSVRPNITYIDQSRHGDAAGNEMITLYGRHLGLNSSVLGVVINDFVAWKVCTFPVWRKSFNLEPLHGQVNRMIPSVQCITAATTVGWKNVTLFSDSFISLPYTRYQVTCKAGSFGGVGEMCSSCDHPSSNTSVISGMLCPYDNMENPIAAPGDERVRGTVSILSRLACSTKYYFVMILVTALIILFLHFTALRLVPFIRRGSICEVPVRRVPEKRLSVCLTVRPNYILFGGQSVQRGVQRESLLGV
jgi:hypothetical protein